MAHNLMFRAYSHAFACYHSVQNVKPEHFMEYNPLLFTCKVEFFVVTKVGNGHSKHHKYSFKQLKYIQELK